MNFPQKTLDLTCFNRATFAGNVRIRHIADWCNDYWKNGYTLSRIKLHDDEWHALIEELRDDNAFMMDKLHNGTLSVDLGFGPVEIINVDKK